MGRDVITSAVFLFFYFLFFFSTNSLPCCFDRVGASRRIQFDLIFRQTEVTKAISGVAKPQKAPEGDFKKGEQT